LPLEEDVELKEIIRKNALLNAATWLKTGMLLVRKSEPKEKIIKKIAKNLQKIRSVTTAK